MSNLSLNLAAPISIRGVCAGNARNSKPTLTITITPVRISLSRRTPGSSVLGGPSRVVTIGGGLGDPEATHRQYGLSSWGAQ
jgi:hypothetical protein